MQVYPWTGTWTCCISNFTAGRGDQVHFIMKMERVSKIYLIRGKKVMIDRDLAELYGVETRVLNQAARLNERRFPDVMVDFA